MASAGAARAEKTARRLPRSWPRPRRCSRAAATTAPRRRTSPTCSASARQACTTTSSRRKPRSRRCARRPRGLRRARSQRILRAASSASDKVAQLVFQHLAPLAERLDFTLVFLRERRFLPAARAQAHPRDRAALRAHHPAHHRAGRARAASSARDLDARMATLALLGLGNSAALWYRARARRHARAHHRAATSNCWCARSGQAR